MSKKDIRNLIILVVCLAIGSDLVWNLIRQPKVVTATPAATSTIAPTTTPTPTATVVPTMVRTPFPTFEPTQVPGPSGTGWKPLYDFGGGPSVSIKASCYVKSLIDCTGKEVEIYLEGYQANEVYLNGFDGEHQDLWTARLVPGSNRLVVLEAEDIGIGNKTDITVQEASSTGYYLSCALDEFGDCVCSQYNDWTMIYQSPTIGGGKFLTTIEFWSEYSPVFFLNDMVEKKSTPIESGMVLVLPEYDHETWDITVLPFFGPRPTPMPSRTPTPIP